jgi:hypothetical protein
MLISEYDKDWLTHLDAQWQNIADSDSQLYLLMDGVFIPGLHRSFHQLSPSLLFEARPGCTDETRDVSPFVIPYGRNSTNQLISKLGQCSGWPMISAIVSSETQTQIAERLAAWCVVEVDKQWFNFRFPDTRLLPRIFSVLTLEQRQQIAGPATHWSFMGRNGVWQELQLDPSARAIAVVPPILSEKQFADLVADSETDEMITMLQDRGHVTGGDPFHRYTIISMALEVSQFSALSIGDKVDWCESCVVDGLAESAEKMKSRFSDWLSTRVGLV